MICSNCQHKILEEAAFCAKCGTRVQESGSEQSAARYPLKEETIDGLTTEIRALFFKDLEAIVDEEIGRNKYRVYFDQFYKSGFYKNFDLRVKQLAEEISGFQTMHNTQVKIDQLLMETFQGFIDHFIVLHCKELHQINLPEALLKYSTATRETIDLRQMTLDYMDFNNENDKVYTDLISIPEVKIKNAVQSFLFAKPEETIFFICDQTVFGSCKEGFSMTNQALHWKSHFNAPQSVYYDDLKEIKREAEWLNINGLFFNVNKTLNFKMMKLLKKLRSLERI